MNTTIDWICYVMLSTDNKFWIHCKLSTRTEDTVDESGTKQLFSDRGEHMEAKIVVICVLLIGVANGLKDLRKSFLIELMFLKEVGRQQLKAEHHLLLDMDTVRVSISFVFQFLIDSKIFIH